MNRTISSLSPYHRRSRTTPIISPRCGYTLSSRLLRYISGVSLLGLLAAVLFVTGCTPKANLQADVTSGAAPLTVTFRNATSAFLFNKADEFQWDFGDNVTATSATREEPVTHQYLKAGSHTVTLTAVKRGDPPKTTSKTLTITVDHGALSAIKMNPGQAEMAIGKSQEFSAGAVDAYDNPIPESPLNWTATEGAGTLAVGGMFTAGTKAGTYDRGITASASLDGHTAESFASITVKPDPLETVAISPIEVAAGETQQLLVVGTDRYGNRLSGVATAWTGTSDDAGSVTQAGMFTANKVGGTFPKSVSVTVTQGEIVLNAEAPVTIKPGTLEQVVIGPEKAEIGMGMSQQFMAVGADRYGNRISGLTFTWRLDGSGTVSPSGLFTAGNEPGAFTIQAEATQGGVTKFGKTSVMVESDRIAFISERNDKQADIYIMDSDGGNIERLTETSTSEWGVSVSADGRRIIYDSFTQDDGIMVMNDQGKWLSLILSNAKDFAYIYPAFSPDGSKIVVTKLPLKVNSTSDLFIMDADGGNLRQLTDTPGEDEKIAQWSPDGTRLVYSIGVGTGPWSIWVINADGTGKKRLTPGATDDTNPAWSPDGTQIVFSSSRDGDYDIYVMNADGSNVRPLTKNSNLHEVRPAWSPDGNKILYISDYASPEKMEIWVMNADGSNATKLTVNLVEESRAQWMPRKAGITVTEASVIIPDASKLKDLTAQEVTNRAKAAVVRIKTDLGSGSGFLISPDGLILTANHVVTDAKEITVYLTNGINYKATVKSRDMVRDMATIEITATNLPYLEFGDLSRVGLGQPVIVLGYPLGQESVSVTSGLVSTIDYDGGRNITWVQTDSAINPGNSGGPLLNLRGQVIGIITSKMVGTGVEGVGFAISANTIDIYLPQLKK